MGRVLKPKFKRDSRSPKPKDAKASLSMSRVSLKGSKPEVIVRKFLSSRGLTGYRLNYTRVLGRPDICFNRRRVAIFINGCFWHRCPYCKLPLPKSNREFWSSKFKTNKKRDRRNEKLLLDDGWEVITLWECQITKNDNWKRCLLKKIKEAE